MTGGGKLGGPRDSGHVICCSWHAASVLCLWQAQVESGVCPALRGAGLPGCRSLGGPYLAWVRDDVHDVLIPGHEAVPQAEAERRDQYPALLEKSPVRAIPRPGGLPPGLLEGWWWGCPWRCPRNRA